MNRIYQIGGFVHRLKKMGPFNDWMQDLAFDDIYELGLNLMSKAIYL